MARRHEAASEGGAPEYMVSYADMLTIMLAFFIVLYASAGANSSNSKSNQDADAKKNASANPKDNPGESGRKGDQGKAKRNTDALADSDPDKALANNERFDQVLKSLYYRFGPEWTVTNCWVGGPPELRNVGTDRVKRGSGVRSNGKPNWGQIGDDTLRARAPKPNENILAGGRIHFDEFSAQLAEPEKQRLRKVAEELAGKMQRIEIRGHTSRRPLPADSAFRDHWDLSYARCRAVRDCLVSHGIDPRRIRLAAAGDNEPLDSDGEVISIKQNSRADIHMLNEVVRPASSPREGHPAPAEKAVPSAAAATKSE